MFDHLLFALVVLITPALEWRWLYPRLRRDVAHGDPAVRRAYYRTGMLMSWGLTGLVLAWWIVSDRPWESLLLGMVTTVQLAIGCGLAVVGLVLTWVQWRVVCGNPKHLEMVRRSLGQGQALLPHTPGERRSFLLVAVTAGICEEVLYRGFVMGYVGTWTGPELAVVLSSVAFGLAHLYLGFSHVIRTTVVGAVYALIALAAGSLWPAMILHVATDLVGGDLAYRAVQASVAGTSPAAP